MNFLSLPTFKLISLLWWWFDVNEVEMAYNKDFCLTHDYDEREVLAVGSDYPTGIWVQVDLGAQNK